MKTNILGIAFLGATLLFACNESSKEKTVIESSYAVEEVFVSDASQANQATFIIEGMTCQMGCVNAVDKALRSVNGVTTVQIDFDAEKTQDVANVTFNESETNAIEMAEKIESIANHAYKVVGVKVTKFKAAEANNTNENKETEIEDKKVLSVVIPNPFNGVLSAFGLSLPN